MKYKSIAVPLPSIGLKISEKRQVVPDQAMTIEEILARFTRGESVAVGRDVNYHESEDDLEKLSHMDLVDREEYVNKLKQVQKEYNDQEAAKLKATRKRLLDEAKAEAKAQALKEAQEAYESRLKP